MRLSLDNKYCLKRIPCCVCKLHQSIVVRMRGIGSYRTHIKPYGNTFTKNLHLFCAVKNPSSERIGGKVTDKKNGIVGVGKIPHSMMHNSPALHHSGPRNDAGRENCADRKSTRLNS